MFQLALIIFKTKVDDLDLGKLKTVPLDWIMKLLRTENSTH